MTNTVDNENERRLSNEMFACLWNLINREVDLLGLPDNRKEAATVSMLGVFRDFVVSQYEAKTGSPKAVEALQTFEQRLRSLRTGL